MKSLMIRISTNSKEKLVAMKCIEVELARLCTSIKPQTKAYLTDGKVVFGTAVVKTVFNKGSIKIIVLDSFKEYKPYL